MAKPWKQNATFEDSAAPAEEEKPSRIVHADGEAPAKGGNKNKVYVIIVIAVAAVVALLGIYAGILKDKDEDNTMNTPGSVENSDPIPVFDPDQFGIGGDNSFVLGFTYSQEERARLRAWGYTAEEISEAEANETPADDLIAASQEQQRLAAETLGNPDTPEFKYLQNQTWIGETQRSTVTYSYDDWSFGTRRINADYTKCDAYGTNLMLRVDLPEGGHHFMEVGPDRYCELPQTGNIVVDYDIIITNGQTYIKNMREVDVNGNS